MSHADAFDSTLGPSASGLFRPAGKEGKKKKSHTQRALWSTARVCVLCNFISSFFLYILYVVRWGWLFLFAESDVCVSTGLHCSIFGRIYTVFSLENNTIPKACASIKIPFITTLSSVAPLQECYGIVWCAPQMHTSRNRTHTHVPGLGWQCKPREPFQSLFEMKWNEKRPRTCVFWVFEGKFPIWIVLRADCCLRGMADLESFQRNW